MTDIEKTIQEETASRLTEFEKPSYEFPQKLSKIDTFLIAALMGASLFLIVLCMVGVIR